VQVRQGADAQDQSWDSLTCPAGGGEVGQDAEGRAEGLSLCTVIPHTACKRETVESGAAMGGWSRVRHRSRWDNKGIGQWRSREPVVA